MSESELSEARHKIERLEAELARTTKVQEDLWAHQIYIKARQKMTIGVFAVVGVLSGLGLFTAYDIYKELLNFSTDLAKRKIESTIDSKVDEMVKKAEPELQDQLRRRTDVLIENAVEAVKARINVLNERVSAAERAAERADYASERLKQIALVRAAPEEAEQEDTERGGTEIDCNPLNLTGKQSALVRIEQSAQATDTVSSQGLRFYKNSFSVAVHSKDRPAVSPSLTACVLNAIDRVVYNLNARWFARSKVVRIDKDNGFLLSRSVWGPTEVSAAVYLKGQQDPINYFGMFMIVDQGGQYLEKGIPDPLMRGGRPQ